MSMLVEIEGDKKIIDRLEKGELVVLYFFGDGSDDNPTITIKKEEVK